MVPTAVKSLDALLRPNDLVLELGSGASTTWYGKRARAVVSLEANRAWANWVRRRLLAEGLKNCDIVEGPIEIGLKSLLCQAAFDVVVVDFSDEPGFNRAAAAKAVASTPAPPRLIILDDSDRPAYRDVFPISEYQATRYIGLKTAPLRATETTIFVRR
jgi:hypothetical protein